MSEKLETGTENPANRQHLCAKNVVHEQWGKGQCLPEMHAIPDANGHVAWYDVMFEHGVEKSVMVEDLQITLAEKHTHSKKKMNEEMMKCEECGEEYEKGEEHECEMEESMDPVNKDALKKKFADRKDKDIDNDGDEDEADEFLHKRRKAVAKAVEKDSKMESYMKAITKSLKNK